MAQFVDLQMQAVWPNHLAHAPGACREISLSNGHPARGTDRRPVRCSPVTCPCRWRPGCRRRVPCVHLCWPSPSIRTERGGRREVVCSATRFDPGGLRPSALSSGDGWSSRAGLYRFAALSASGGPAQPAPCLHRLPRFHLSPRAGMRPVGVAWGRQPLKCAYRFAFVRICATSSHAPRNARETHEYSGTNSHLSRPDRPATRCGVAGCPLSAQPARGTSPKAWSDHETWCRIP